jgi:hypothetical protein
MWSSYPMCFRYLIFIRSIEPYRLYNDGRTGCGIQHSQVNDDDDQGLSVSGLPSTKKLTNLREEHRFINDAPFINLAPTVLLHDNQD